MVQTDWLTNFPSRRMGSLALYHMAKSRWEIENQGFNDAKNRYGMEHVCHHGANSILLNWLITFLALVIEGYIAFRHLHRGTQPVRSARELCRLLWLGLSRPRQRTPVENRPLCRLPFAQSCTTCPPQPQPGVGKLPSETGRLG